MTARLLVRAGLVEVALVLTAIALLPASTGPDPAVPVDGGAEWHGGNTTRRENSPNEHAWPSPIWLDKAP